METHRYSRVRIAALLIAGSLLCTIQGAGGNQDNAASQASRWLLYPEQDESSVETKIAAYLKEKDGTNAVMANIGDDATDLVCLYAAPTKPRLLIAVDTHIAGVNRQTRKVTARSVEVSGHYILPDSAKTPVLRGRLLDLVNTWHQAHLAPGHICLDRKGDLELTTHVIIPSPDVPIHAEVVRDSVYRMVVLWSDFYAQVAKTADLPIPEGEIELGSLVPQPLKSPGELGDAVEWRSIKHRSIELPN
jgi:hypothetical protein